ncbi:hypothetical protein KDL01_26550 [Actinospica durhamensis]|uniref:Uncharacterized protein n=1 Tax=Actinospica durhamensis TaxID=1508375 RepID=A0A941ERU3_9ACTN|nr:hypothetical protein [Actinospica durhamensis]MBR7836867.1 hypothetical protein [Actinospica durhamensis]
MLLPASPASAAQVPAGQRQLRVVNNSSRFFDLCVYQTPVESGGGGVLPLAWLTKPAWPTTTVTFDWRETYDFVWGDAGDVVPGSTFEAGQIWPADLNDPVLQQVRLEYDRGAFTFERRTVTGQPTPGSLYIQEAASVPPARGDTVGIGMSGAGMLIVPTQPNFNLVFTPRPAYYVAAGTFVTGQILDLSEITSAAPVVFPPDVTSMVATIGLDERWTVVPASV